jgi:hypothetical protein
VKEELQKTTKVQKMNQEVNKWEDMLTKMMSLQINYEDIERRNINFNAWQYLAAPMKKLAKKIN